jgi:hypothetical protein
MFCQQMTFGWFENQDFWSKFNDIIITRYEA